MISNNQLTLRGAVPPESVRHQMSKHQNHMVTTKGEQRPKYEVKAELESLAPHFSLSPEIPKSSQSTLSPVYSGNCSSYAKRTFQRDYIIVKPLRTQIKKIIFRLHRKGQDNC